MKLIAVILPCVLALPGYAQNPTRFAGEIEAITNRTFQRKVEIPMVVFTGSSSIRMWHDVDKTFSGYQILNNGFGGSEFSDLIHNKEELIYDFSPDILFIYEGDNDISSGKSVKRIIEDAELLLSDIKKKLPETKVFIISPKPSISRWHLKSEYEQLNAALEQLTQSAPFADVGFVDVWTPMLNEKGEVRTDLFLEDDLHMNSTGYQIWANVIGEYLPEN